VPGVLSRGGRGGRGGRVTPETWAKPRGNSVPTSVAAESLAGKYRLTLVAMLGPASDDTTRGTLELWQRPLREQLGTGDAAVVRPVLLVGAAK